MRIYGAHPMNEARIRHSEAFQPKSSNTSSSHKVIKMDKARQMQSGALQRISGLEYIVSEH